MRTARNPKRSQPHFFHFVHVPKCGGTSLTSVLRRASCRLLAAYSEENPGQLSFAAETADCCTPGFCENPDRLCASVSGCQNHIPQLGLVGKGASLSVTMLRDPVARVVSAWFYRCHSPNRDCYNVRGEFCQVGGRRGDGEGGGGVRKRTRAK
jgi:hypothetical protein